jgi:hypothetical protein
MLYISLMTIKVLKLLQQSISNCYDNQQWKLKYPTTDWSIDYLQFYVPLKNFSLIWRCHHYRWRAAKLRPAVLGAQGLWAGRDLYHVTPAMTRRSLRFSGLIRRAAPSSHLLRHTRRCGESILARVLTGPHSIAPYDTQGCVEDLF